MRLYSVQPEPYWQICQARGCIRPDHTMASRDGYENFLVAYAWMKEQMAIRLPAFSGQDPVWAWHDRPDLSHVSGWPRRDPYVLLTIDVPDERVLLSNFGMWHHVLNDVYLGTEEEEAILDKLHDEDPTRWSDTLDEWSADIERKRHGWEHIFDLPRWTSQGHPRVQACIDGVSLFEVKKVKRFMSVLDLEFGPRLAKT